MSEHRTGRNKRTCRYVGAHIKEARKEGKTPARLEYNKDYNLLKTRRARGKLSVKIKKNKEKKLQAAV